MKPLMRVFGSAAALFAALLFLTAPSPLPAASALTLVETPMFEDAVKDGRLPPVADRLPSAPSVVTLSGDRKPGRHGGDLRMLIGRSRDVRLFVVYGYARLVAYTENFELVPDILESIDIEEGRIFTLHLRPGHKWSDGEPFTSEDFRYWWIDVANNPNLSPSGPPVNMLVNGELPVFEVVDETTVRYTWPANNPSFLPRLAGASPLFIYRPAHFLKKYHADYATEAELDERIGRARNWASQHNRQDNMYRFDNPNLPTLQPWINTTTPPATRFKAERNPYFHRVDENGLQLPYIDRFIMSQATPQLIPAKAGAGEVDLQSRNLYFNNYTFLREAQKRNGFETYLWREAKGSHFALFPNLNINDPVWREVMRDARFRRALSLAIDRDLINETIFFGLAISGNNTVLPESPLFREEYQTKWAQFDIGLANELLDQMGLTKRKGKVRLLPQVGRHLGRARRLHLSQPELRRTGHRRTPAHPPDRRVNHDHGRHTGGAHQRRDPYGGAGPHRGYPAGSRAWVQGGGRQGRQVDRFLPPYRPLLAGEHHLPGGQPSGLGHGFGIIPIQGAP